VFEHDRLPELMTSAQALASAEVAATRRSLILAPRLSALPAFRAASAHAETINPRKLKSPFRVQSNSLRGCRDFRPTACRWRRSTAAWTSLVSRSFSSSGILAL
jgi:hypothetical protein